MPRLGIVCRLNACNVGDSAMYDNLVAHIPTGWEPIPIVDSMGAVEACIRNGYPGATTEMDVDLSRLDAVIVGGGDFDPSVTAARLPSTMPVLCMGLSFGPGRLESHLYRNLLARARHVYLRDYDSYDLLGNLRCPNATPTCDLAWDLPYSARSPHDPGPVLVTLRAPMRMPPEEDWPAPLLKQAVDACEASGLPWSVLPCNVDDERWSLEAGAPAEKVIPSRWWPPGEATTFKGIVASARFVITIGRLHPAIFAASLHVPVVAVATQAVQVGPKLHGLYGMLSLSSLCGGAQYVDEAWFSSLLREYATNAEGHRWFATHLKQLDPMQSASIHWQGLRDFLS